MGFFHVCMDVEVIVDVEELVVLDVDVVFVVDVEVVVEVESCDKKNNLFLPYEIRYLRESNHLPFRNLTFFSPKSVFLDLLKNFHEHLGIQ